MKLTSKKYWEEYYQASPESKELITTVCSRYDDFYDMFVRACAYKPQSILEIGAFPGRYLAYLSTKYHLKATGIDFNPDQQKFTRSMRAMGVDDFDYICTDFTKHVPDREYDLVFSNGFIEHFTNYDEILNKHVRYLSNGGAMMVMIPNKKYLRKVYGYILDQDNLRAHNLDCMRLKVFEDFAKRNNLNVKYLSYEGGFAYKVHQRLNLLQRIIYKPVRFLSIKFDRILRRNPSKWYSATIIAIFSKQL